MIMRTRRAALLLAGGVAVVPAAAAAQEAPGAPAAATAPAAPADDGGGSTEVVGPDTGLVVHAAGGWQHLLGDTDLTARVRVVVRPPDSASGCPATTVTLVGDRPPGAPGTGAVATVRDDDPQQDGGLCVVSADVALDRGDAAGGTALVTVAGTQPATTAFTARRSTRAAVYVGGGVVAIALAFCGALASASRFRKHRDGRPWPADWTVEDSLVTSVTAVATAAAALLTTTGVLEEFVPQYRLGGVLAGTFVVALLLVLAPLLHAVLGRGGTGYVAAATATLGAALVQVGLIALVVLNADLTTGWRQVVAGLAGAVGLVAVAFVVRYGTRLAQDDSLSASL